MRKLKIGLLGCGTVGGGFVRLLEKNRRLIRQQAEVDLEINRILVRDVTKDRPGVDPRLLTTRAEDVLHNGADAIVELIGGTEPARTFIRDAIARRKHVITANKNVLALAGTDLLELAEIHRVSLRFEASVCGAIPIVRVIRDGLAGSPIRSIRGIVNGTCNYILTRMSEDSADFPAALRDAQVRGFAEANPSLDVDGEDAAQKITILAQLAFPGRELRWLRREGIRQVTRNDLAAAESRGQTLRHVASARERDGLVELRVGPEVLDARDALARVRNEQNGVVLETESAGELAFYGLGAGSLPSASSVLADVVEIARNR